MLGLAGLGFRESRFRDLGPTGCRFFRLRCEGSKHQGV